MTDPEVIAISRNHRLALLDTGEVVPMVEWVDCEGDDTPDPHEAAAMIGRLADGSWIAVAISAFEPTPTH